MFLLSAAAISGIAIHSNSSKERHRKHFRLLKEISKKHQKAYTMLCSFKTFSRKKHVTFTSTANSFKLICFNAISCNGALENLLQTLSQTNLVINSQTIRPAKIMHNLLGCSSIHFHPHYSSVYPPITNKQITPSRMRSDGAQLLTTLIHNIREVTIQSNNLRKKIYVD